MFLNCHSVCASSLFCETPNVRAEISRNRAGAISPKSVSATSLCNASSAQLRPNEGSALHDSESSTLCILARFYSLLPRNDDRSFSSDPFTDIRWAVPQFCSVQFAKRQESYGLAIHEKHVPKI